MNSKREVYINKQNNTEMTAEAIFVVDVQDVADKDNYLPLNKLRITNESENKIYVYLDTLPSDNATPDYVIGASLGVNENYEDGINFNTLYIKNKGTDTIPANKIFCRVAKVEEVTND